MSMEYLNNTSIQVSFNTVLNMINRKQTTISKNGMANLKRSILFLDTVIKSIDSLDGGFEQDGKNIYYFVPNLKEMIDISEKRHHKDKVTESKRYFSEAKSGLELLKENPDELYMSPKAPVLQNTISRIIDIYSEEPHIVERDFTLSEKFL
jgi:hypothetical protein